VAVPTLLVHSKNNCYVPQQEMHILAHYFNVQLGLELEPRSEDSHEAAYGSAEGRPRPNGGPPARVPQVLRVVYTILIMIEKDVAPRDSYLDMLAAPMPRDTAMQRHILVRYSSSSRIVVGSLACLFVGGAFGASLGNC